MLYHIHDHASSHTLLCFITYIITKRFFQNTKNTEREKNYITGPTRLLFFFSLEIFDIKTINFYWAVMAGVWLNITKALIALVGRLTQSVEWENGPERELKTVLFNLNFL